MVSIRKHADARNVNVEPSFAAEGVGLSVTDDGSGFDPDNADFSEGHGGFGINGMRQRAQLLSGGLTVVSAPGKGARVQIGIATS